VNRDHGLEETIRVMGGVGALARALSIAQPSVSVWRRVPAERVLAVEALSGISRSTLRPDLYPEPEQAPPAVDEVDEARAQEYALLAMLLRDAPDARTLRRLSRLDGDATPLGRAHAALAVAAGEASAEKLRREFFDLFLGVGRGELLPYASYYLTGFLNERPLARLREDIARLGLERADESRDPEDNIGTLCEIMSGLAGGRFEAPASEERQFFLRHLAPWAASFFADLESANAARFYKAVGTVGRTFMEIEAEAFALEH
jgi:TorA maturation chaperone TorD